MEKIYISGKMSGLPALEVKHKFLAAKKKLLDEMVCQVYSPLDIAEGPTWEGNMIEDLKMLIKCNTIYMLNDWHDSPGATIEHAFARRMGLKIIYENSPGVHTTSTGHQFEVHPIPADHPAAKKIRDMGLENPSIFIPKGKK